jgi:hypothetical protein
VLVCHPQHVQQPWLRKRVRAVRTGISIRAQLHMRGMPCGPVLWACMSAHSVEAAQALVCGAQRRCCQWWTRRDSCSISCNPKVVYRVAQYLGCMWGDIAWMYTVTCPCPSVWRHGNHTGMQLHGAAYNFA